MNTSALRSMLQLETATSEWWNGLSSKEKEAYKRAHPRSRYAGGDQPDRDAAHDLHLYAVNDGEAYRRNIVPIIQNLRRKKSRGVYDHTKALKLWTHHMDEAAQRYRKEFGEAEFSPATRRAAAALTADHYHEHVHGYEAAAEQGAVHNGTDAEQTSRDLRNRFGLKPPSVSRRNAGSLVHRSIGPAASSQIHHHLMQTGWKASSSNEPNPNKNSTFYHHANGARITRSSGHLYIHRAPPPRT